MKNHICNKSYLNIPENILPAIDNKLLLSLIYPKHHVLQILLKAMPKTYTFIEKLTTTLKSPRDPNPNIL